MDLERISGPPDTVAGRPKNLWQGDAGPGGRLLTRIGAEKSTLVGLASLAAGVVLWEIYARVFGDPVFIPTFPDIVAALFGLTGEGEFWSSYATTLEPFLIGWLSALVMGISLGLFMGRSKFATGMSMPHMTFLNALPISTLVPVVVILFGIDLAARSIVVFLFAIVEVVLTTMAGVRFIDDDLFEMGDSFRVSRWKRFTRITLPGATGAIAAAIRVGTGRAVVGMVVMELLLVSVGVGRLIGRYKDAFEAARLYAVVLSLAIFALVLQSVLKAVEQRALEWRGG